MKEKKKKTDSCCSFSLKHNHILSLETKFLTVENNEAVLEDKTIGKRVKRIMLMENSHPFYLNCLSTNMTNSLSFNEHLKSYPWTSDHSRCLQSSSFYCF